MKLMKTSKPVLTIRLFVDESLEPKWTITNTRQQEDKPISGSDRALLNCYASSPTTSDTELSCLLKYHRDLMPDRRVPSLPIVICFDVFKDTGLGHAPSHVPFSVNQFDFQRVEEALRDGVIIAGGSAPHATAQTIALNQLLIAL